MSFVNLPADCRHVDSWHAARVNSNAKLAIYSMAQLLTVHFTALASSMHARLMALFPGLPGWVGTRKVKPIWILLKQETVSGSGISWAICKTDNHASTPLLSFLQAGCPSCRPTNSVKALKAQRLPEENSQYYACGTSHIKAKPWKSTGTISMLYLVRNKQNWYYWTVA